MLKKIFLFSFSFLLIVQLKAETVSKFQIKEFKAHLDSVQAVAFSPGKPYLFSASDDSLIKLWSTQDWRPIRTLSSHIGSVKSLTFSSNKKFMISGSNDHTIQIWNMENLLLYKTIDVDEPANAMDCDPQGRYLAIGHGNGRITIWNTEKWKKIETLKGHTGIVHQVRFTANGNGLISTSRDGVKYWDTITWDAMDYIYMKPQYVFALAVSPDGIFIAFGGVSKLIEIWNLKTRKKVLTLGGHQGSIYSLAFSPDGKFLASGSSDKTIKLWDFLYGTELRTFQGHDGTIYSLSFSDDQKYLASASADRTTRVWEPFYAFIKKNNAPLLNNAKELLTTLPIESPIVIESCKEQWCYVKVKNGLKGWVEYEQIAFDPPDLVSPTIQIFSQEIEGSHLILKGAVLDNREIAYVQINERELYPATFFVEKGTHSAVFPFDETLSLPLAPNTVIRSKDKQGNVAEILINPLLPVNP